YTQAFAAAPKLIEERHKGWNRYNAACAAALAGCGQGKDAAGLDPKERARLRRQALDWLRDDLKVVASPLDYRDQNYIQLLARDWLHWLADPGLAYVRGPEALARLPEDERQRWQELWSHVTVMLTRAMGAYVPADRAIALYRETIRLYPKEALNHYYLGLALLGRGRLDDAIAEFREAMRLRPDF